jgi:plasmid maintenance system antidote protein VapI
MPEGTLRAILRQGGIAPDEFLGAKWIKSYGTSFLPYAAMGLQWKHVNELCNERQAVTASTAVIPARVFGNCAEHWSNVQRRSDSWNAMHSSEEL